MIAKKMVSCATCLLESCLYQTSDWSNTINDHLQDYACSSYVKGKKMSIILAPCTSSKNFK